MKIAYLINQYPMPSQTFIRREIRALEAQGFEVARFALQRWPGGDLVDEQDLGMQVRGHGDPVHGLGGKRDQAALAEDRAGALQLLVLGAAGSVGLAAIELGKLMGARVIAAASTPEKLDLCRARGADETIQYSAEDLKNRAKELTDGKGVDVVYDAVGGEHAEAALRAIAWRGRFLVIGFTAGIPRLPLNLTLLKGCQVVGVFYGASRTQEPEIAGAVASELEALTAAGKVRPLVSQRYGLEEVPKALRDVLDRRIVGKVVVEP